MKTKLWVSAGLLLLVGVLFACRVRLEESSVMAADLKAGCYEAASTWSAVTSSAGSLSYLSNCQKSSKAFASDVFLWVPEKGPALVLIDGKVIATAP